MFHYWGFGLCIASEIEFPELLPLASDKPDVLLTLADLPAVEGQTFTKGEFTYTLAASELILTVAGTAAYYAGHGREIKVAPINPVDVGNVQEMRIVRLYILATVMAATLLQRQLLPFHASAILNNGGLMLITGHSGAGKSTTLAGLLKNGHTIFSDDVVVLNKPDGQPVQATASYPMIKLWDDTLVKLAHEQFNDRSFAIKNGLDKYGIFFHHQFDTASHPVKSIVVLKKSDVPQVTVIELEGALAFRELSRQIYRPVLLHNNSLKALAFTKVMALAQTCKVYKVCRPADCAPEQLLLKIEELLYEA